MSLVTNLLGRPHKMWGPSFQMPIAPTHSIDRLAICTSALRYPDSVIPGTLVFAWHSNRHILTLAQFRGSRCCCKPGNQLIVIRLPRRVAQRQNRRSAHALSNIYTTHVFGRADPSSCLRSAYPRRE